jgi:hypothetical protein
MHGKEKEEHKKEGTRKKILEENTRISKVLFFLPP